MVKITKLYTKFGDQGQTALLGGATVSKSSDRVEAYGTIDELNSWLGLIAANIKEKNFSKESTKGFIESTHHKLLTIQQELFDLGAELATPEESDWKPPSSVSADDYKRLESEIDQWTSSVPPLNSFILPGGSILVSYIHIARTVCRRAERRTVTTHENSPLRNEILIYLNRLSDWLFALSRVVAKESGEQEILWDAKRKS